MDIGLIGFGGVGQALAGLLIEKKKYLREKYNLEINLKYIINSSGGFNTFNKSYSKGKANK